MNSHLTYLLAREHAADLARAAERDRLARVARHSQPNAQRGRLLARVMAYIRSGEPASGADGQVGRRRLQPLSEPSAQLGAERARSEAPLRVRQTRRSWRGVK